MDAEDASMAWVGEGTRDVTLLVVMNTYIKHGRQMIHSHVDPVNVACALSLLPSEVTNITALLQWFKGSFFSWVDQPPCTACATATQYTHTTVHGGIRVEQYMCAACSSVVPFPRYK
jgi:hypothetical protein